MCLLRAEPRDREDDDVVRAGSELSAELRTTGGEKVGLLPERLDVDRVRKHVDPLRLSATLDHRAPRERPCHQRAGGSAHDRRHDRSLHGSSPAGSRAGVVALHEEQVRDPPDTAPGDRGLGGKRAPARDDDDVGPCPLEGTRDAGSDWVVVANHALGSGNAKPAEEARVVLVLDRPLSPADHGRRGVHHRELDLVERCDVIEERRPVRRRLGEDGGDADRATGARLGPEELSGLLPNAAPGFGTTRPPADYMDTQRGIYRERRSQQPCSRHAARRARPSCDRTSRGFPHTAQLVV